MCVCMCVNVQDNHVPIGGIKVNFLTWVLGTELKLSEKIAMLLAPQL